MMKRPTLAQLWRTTLALINPREYPDWKIPADLPTERARWVDMQIIYAIHARDTTDRDVFVALSLPQMRALAKRLTEAADMIERVSKH